MNTQLGTIGKAESVSFPELGLIDVHARIDTGARTSSIWASEVSREGEELRVIFFGEGSGHYDGRPHFFRDFSRAMVASSNGQAEPRYKVRLLVEVQGRKIRAHFTLADRKDQAYPVLIGRNVLRGKFVVDVSTGIPSTDAERERSRLLQARLEEE